MKTAITAAVSTAVLGVAALAQPASAQEVDIRDAVARVIVIVEDRTDIGVEITQGSAHLPQLTLQRRGGDVRIEGGVDGRNIRNCNAGPSNARQPGEGATVEVRGAGRLRMEDAPLIVLRTPRDVDVKGEGALYGAIGRGARSVELGNGGCGVWTVANVDGAMDLALGGSGAIRAGSSNALEANLGGSGSITAGATRELEANIGGSGDITVARLDGSAKIAVAGSGNVRVRSGSASRLAASIAGSGDVRFEGTVRDVQASIAGSGDVHVAEATGAVNRSIVGSGQVRIGR
jgi:hypothetical protein